MSQNVSDYTSPFNFSIADHIPENYQNPLNVAINKSIFDRFLTDAETQRVIGTVGRPNTSSASNQQVVEGNVFDQAYQLQPVVQVSAGSETFYYNYKDLLTALTQIGVDPAAVQTWQSTEAFNFFLPIDLDKYVNYTNYFWVSTATPDYVTIRNPQTVLQMQVAQQVANYGHLFASGDTSRAALWTTIAEGLDYIHSYVATADQILISGLDVALADSIHAPYVATTRTDRPDLVLTNGWQESNRWVHRMHVTDLTNATRAAMPILEYSNLTQMTNWTFTSSAWRYRRSQAIGFQTTTAQPTDAEIFNRFPLVATDADANSFTIAGDQTGLFAAGKQFVIEESTVYSGFWTATSVTFDGTSTVLTVKENVISGTINGNVVPYTVTSQGDPWVSFYEQWAFVRNNPSVPVTPPANQIVAPSATVVATAGQTVFDLPSDLTYVVGSNTLEVTVDGVRVYGTYEESSSTSVTFDNGLNAGQQVMFALAARTANDQRRMNVPVRIYTSTGSRVVQDVCLVQYRNTPQQKTAANQYPLFDLVNLDGTPMYQSSSLISFTESSTAAINPTFGKRIVTDAATKDFTMTIDVTDGELKGFVYNGAVTTVWTDAGLVQPQLVDENGNATTDATGVWSIPEQFTSNLHHEIRSSLKFSELFSHFRSIASSQPLLDASVYGSVDALSGYHLHSTVNYGLGGSIREHNGSFDTLVSTIISTDHSYADVIGFARDQYRELMVEYYTRVETALIETLAANDPASINNLAQSVSQLTISNIETDSLLYKLYGDSTVGLKYGSIANWIATVPFFGWKTPSQPELLIDSKRNIFEVIHHDGHSVVDELDFTSFGQMVESIVFKLNLYSATKTSTISADLKVGQVAYDSSTNMLYRLNVVAVGTQPPSLSAYADGTYWASTANNQLYEKINNAWVAIGSSLDPAWETIDVGSIVLAAIVNLEQQLYTGAAKVAQKANPLDLVLEDQYASYRQSAFEAWAARTDVLLPYQGDYSATDPFTWYYTSNQQLAHSPSADALQWGARAYRINELNFGTKYPHLQPWVLQGYTTAPSWWSVAYAGTTRRWSTAMWTNILSGTVPEGYALPNDQTSTGTPGEVKAWNFVSVNITDHTTADGYGPDDLLPTYWVPISPADDIAGIADQVFLNVPYNQLMDIAKNWYPFGSFGPFEQQWVDSVDYFYDLLRAEFLIRPSDMVHETFGEEYITVGGLDICKRDNLVYTHTNAIFHGDVDTNGNLVLMDGVNQWYTQFFRYINLDTNANSYKDIWTKWQTHLSYNVGAYVIDNTLSISSTQVELSESDYSIASKTNVHVRDMWIDALYVNVAQVGTLNEMPKGAGRDWKFNVFVNCPISRPINYYDVYKAAVTSDQTTGIFTLGNNKTLSGYGWTAGQPVVFDTGIGGILPDAIDNMTYYFIIPVSDTTFKIALNADDAAAGKAIVLQSDVVGVCYVGELQSTFYAISQQNAQSLWRHFKTSPNVLSFTGSTQITGIQNLIDLVDGYQAYLLSQGFLFNQSDAIEYDAATGRQLSWQFEIERVINSMYMYAASGAKNLKAAIGTFDINPFRNNLWISHAQGVVSSFESQDATQAQYRAFVYDNTGAAVSTKDYHVLREDKQSMLTVVSPTAFVDQIATNDFATVQYLPNNIGGAHVFFDDYEHTVVFSDYAISGDLVWDQFLGIQVPRVWMYFEKQVGTPKRPNIGGYVLGKDGVMQQNLEYTVANITNYYDTFTVNENSDFIGYARSLLGYRENVGYMAEIGATPKSQFLFYKGLIQNKGTLGSITAFTNAASLNAADVDEFWAYKLFEFGENKIKASYMLNLQPTDTIRSQMKLQFAVAGETIDSTFTSITASDSTRWLEYPNQRAAIQANDNVSFELKPDTITQVTPLTAKGFISNYYVKHDAADAVQLILASGNRASFSNVSSEQITLPFSYPMGVNALTVFVNGQVSTNFTELSMNRINVPGSLDGTVIVSLAPAALKEGVHYKRINNRIVQFLIDPRSLTLNLVRYVADIERCLPISLLDNVSRTTVADMVTWDPTNGQYTDEVNLTVDVFADTDPAVYNTIPDTSRLDKNKFWNLPEQGSVWMDTSSYRFVPYNDAVAQDTQTRLLNWARMEEWSAPTAYTWIGTAVAPSNWTDGTPYQQVFQRTRDIGTVTFANNVGTITGVTLTDAQEVIFVGSAGPVIDGMIYVLRANGNGFNILDQVGNVITGFTNGSSWTVMSASFTNPWTTVENLKSVIECAEIGTASNIPSGLPANTEYSMYFDGVFCQDGYTNADGSVDLDPVATMPLIAANPFATQLSLYNKTGVLDGLSTTEPEAFELTGETVQQFVTTPYVTTTVYNEATNQATNYYYYWVTGSSVLVGSGGYLTSQIEAYVNKFTKPYVIFSNPVIRNNKYALSQLVAIGISGLVSDTNRYVLRLVRDDTLRDRSYEDSDGNLLRPIHSEWKLFRQNQDSNVDRMLWNKVTEAMVGYRLSDPTIPVPALDRVVYDKLNGTNTRFGMEVGQAFCDGEQAKVTIMAELNDPTVDFTPNDIDVFLETHSLDTVANIITFMDDLYATFTPARVNQVFFSVMMDGLSKVGANYSTGLIKTSGIAVGSSMPLNVNGALDG